MSQPAASHQSVPPPTRTRRGAALVVAGFTATLLLTSCANTAEPVQLTGVENIAVPEYSDFSTSDRVTAFQQAVEVLASQYALTDWKYLDWQQLYGKHLPAIEGATDPDSYYLALHAFLTEVGDGHVHLGMTETATEIRSRLVAAQTGGSYGITIAKLDSGEVIVTSVTPESTAALAGVQPGDLLLTWNGSTALGAIDQVNLGELAGAGSFATSAGKQLEQARLLTRAPVGSTVSAVFLPAAQASAAALAVGTPLAVTLTATADDLAGFHKATFAKPPELDEEEQMLASDILPSGYGYIRNTVLLDWDDPTAYPTELQNEFLTMIAEMQTENVPGLIIDLRGNHGGADEMAATVCGMFTDNEYVYERTSYYDENTGTFVPFTYNTELETEVPAIMVTPQPNRYTGPVVVLANLRTISSAEGLTRCIRDSDNGEFIGFHGTLGSFAMAGGAILMPDGLEIDFPNGRSLDKSGRIQIDSSGGVGGVLPSINVPTNRDNALAIGAGEDVELQEAILWLNEAGKVG